MYTTGFSYAWHVHYNDEETSSKLEIKQKLTISASGCHLKFISFINVLTPLFSQLPRVLLASYSSSPRFRDK